MPKLTQQQQLAALAEAEAALYLATRRRQREPYNSAWQLEQTALQTTVQRLPNFAIIFVF